MLNDLELQQAVLGQLGKDPVLHGTGIEVSVKEGIVTFNGTVRSLSEKWTAERVTQHVPGVTAIVDETVVNLPGDAERSDVQIARAAVTRLEAVAKVPLDKINILVHNGLITIRGEVQYFYQRVEVERALQSLMGVRGIYNELAVVPPVTAAVVKEEVEKALQCVDEIDGQRICVEVTGNQVLLRGDVKTWREHEAAQEAASKIMGVRDVQNKIRVAPWMF
jgi:osmotically-inducible protein OsmY